MKILEPRLILFFAFRYALGRRTMAPSIIVDELKANWEYLSEQDKAQIKEEINNHCCLGDTCDIQTWNEILNLPI